MKGFKEFIMRGNLVELTVAVIIGSVFAAVVTAFTTVLMDVIGKLMPIDPEESFSSIVIAGINIGPFITALITFILTAFIVYFFVVKPYETLRARFEKPAEPEDTTESLLAEIRDLMQQQAGVSAPRHPEQ